jgi:hypothetical protein
VALRKGSIDAGRAAAMLERLKNVDPTPGTR